MSNIDISSSILSKLELDEFIAFDLETTGLNPKKDCITEIAAYRFINGEHIDEYSTLVNPGILIPYNITEITGIDDEILKDAPCLEDVLPGLLKFLGSAPLVGQNLDFDISFINEACIQNASSMQDVPLYDTLSLARTFIYFHNSFNLSSLCDYYDISFENAHRAGADALATGILFKFLIQEAMSRSLNLMQKMDVILKNSNLVYNSKLFSNILRLYVTSNSTNRLMNSPSNYSTPNNIYCMENASKKSEMPKSPLSWFDDIGPINDNWIGYEKRSSQIDLMTDIHSAFNNNYILIAEAGTGLGKSLAYLATGFFSSKEKKIPLIVSTKTKNLQEQIFTKDIPQLSTVLGMDIKTVIYKGKHNYICKTRLENLINNQTHLLSTNECEALMPLLVWEQETLTGDINECNGFQMNRFKRLWSMLRSERGFCSINKCKKYDGCYLGKIREKIKDVDIIIVNHSLFASELKSESSYLPDNFIYVIDEAHHFSNVIRSQLVQEFSIQTFNDVFNFFKFKDNKKNSKSLYFVKYPKIFKMYDKLVIESNVINDRLLSFFKSYYSIRCHGLEKSGYLIEKHLYKNCQEEFIDVIPSPWDLLFDIEGFEKHFNSFNEIIIEDKDKFPHSIIIELEILKSYIKEGILNLKSVLDSNDEIVKWSSFVKKEVDPQVFFSSVPLKVNQFIYDLFLKRYSTGLFCSATLTVNEEFTYFIEKTGIDIFDLNHRIEKKIYSSPFYYSDQVKLFVYNHTIDVKDPHYMPDIARQIDDISRALKRRMLVLCTAYKQIVALRQILEPIIDNDDRHLIVQKPGSSRNLMVRKYLEYPNSILIGTSSFWEGVDFPGDKVEILCIVKTPFDNPYDPIIKSQIEDYTQKGKNAFLKYQVPEATMKLRQGFGRLIRNMNDVGICIIMDTRLYQRQYGEIILCSLPVEAIPYQKVSKLISDAQKFF